MQGRPALGTADFLFFFGQPGRQFGKGIVFARCGSDDGTGRDGQALFFGQFITMQFLVFRLTSDTET